VEVSRADARRPDVVTAELKKGFAWTTQHSQLVALTVVGLFVIGLIWAAVSAWNNSKEEGLQERYFAQEKAYTKKKEAFDKYSSTVNLPPDPKTKEIPKPEGEKASGDLNQDYGPIIQGFQAVIKDASSSHAAALSAMSLLQIYSDYQKPDEALATLKEVQTSSGTLGVITQYELGSQMANKGDCKGALDLWAALAKNQRAEFLKPQMKLKMGVCSESLGDKTKAADLYRDVAESAGSKDTPTGKTAGKYLRLLEASKD